ncbi:hypothetical protein [Natronosalvus halobius]|uniref:hypothetical protein n=1 Tax=Natronosalvus halobius TaxID=2953746 RepID=UPI00209E3442|nr:hypothetical protein [Natronosalvus halobius]USZ71996.1 hypothetical protein NGM15_01420 [Natronosalvus halobius]
MTETSGTFSSWSDRVTYLLAESQLIVLGIMVSLGAALIWIRPSVPGIPPIVFGWFAALLLLGPPLLAVFVTGARKLRNRHMIPVHHINGVEDVREKYYVEPEVWANKTVEGPSPYQCNDNEAFEVREFEWLEDTEDLIVTGCYQSNMADSKLVTLKAMLEDIHGDLIEDSIALNKLRGRISKMGVEIERDSINFQAEADERGLMGQQTSVKERFESARKEADKWDSDEIRDVDDYAIDYDPAENPQGITFEPAEAATDRGRDHE